MRRLLLCALVLPAAGFVSGANRGLLIHEWGTITTIHDAARNAQRRAQSHRRSRRTAGFRASLRARDHASEARTQTRQIAARPGRPDVTMRLETPVIYFHPPPNEVRNAHRHSVQISRRRASTSSIRMPNASVRLDMERIETRCKTVSSRNGTATCSTTTWSAALCWKGLRLHDTVVAPLTRSRLWLAPREVNSVSVFSPEAGEGEQYLFYRGVAHLRALLRRERHAVRWRSATPATLTWLESARGGGSGVWLADVRARHARHHRTHRPPLGHPPPG